LVIIQTVEIAEVCSLNVGKLNSPGKGSQKFICFYETNKMF